jgi:hypothetical protein
MQLREAGLIRCDMNKPKKTDRDKTAQTVKLKPWHPDTVDAIRRAIEDDGYAGPAMVDPTWHYGADDWYDSHEEEENEREWAEAEAKKGEKS